MVGFDAKDAVTLSIAVLGAALGIINTAHSLNQQRVKLRVVPKWAMFVQNGDFSAEMGCIEVINLSAFPVTLSEIGFTIHGNTARKGNRAAIPMPLTTDRQPFARRLESRQALAGYFELRGLPNGIEKAYVKTDCDEVFYGLSGAMENIRRNAGRS